MIIIQRPKTLPEAYSACLELQNLTMRNNILHSKTQPRVSHSPVATNVARGPQRPPRPNFNYSNKFRYANHYHQQSNSSNRPPLYPRAQQPKPEPMETDHSIQTRKVNYMNHPNNADKRRGSEMFRRDKQPRLFHLDTEAEEGRSTPPPGEAAIGDFDSASREQNFMAVGHPAYLT